MSFDKFMQKYPLPWSFNQTDRGGGGVVLDANEQLMVRLVGDDDWDDDLDEALSEEERSKLEPVFNEDEEFHKPDVNTDRIRLIHFIMARINGDLTGEVKAMGFESFKTDDDFAED